MTTYLTIRALHVLFGALWTGIAVFSALWLMPLAQDLGPDAQKMAQSLQRRGYIVAVPVIAIAAILSGIWLYWRYTGGFSAEASRTPSAMAFGTGGVLAILSLLIGGMFISRNMVRATALSRSAATAPDGERAAMIGAAAGLRRRATAATRLVAFLLATTVVLMSVAHYL